MNSKSLRPPKLNEARRSQRVIISIRVVVSGKRPRGQTLVEETVTAVVNAHGALVLLGEPVDSGQLLTIRNAKSGKERLCSVVGIGHLATYVISSVLATRQSELAQPRRPPISYSNPGIHLNPPPHSSMLARSTQPFIISCVTLPACFTSTVLRSVFPLASVLPMTRPGLATLPRHSFQPKP